MQADLSHPLSHRWNVLSLLETERKVLQQITSGTSLSSVLDQLARAVENQSAVEMRASILLVNHEAGCLLWGSGPSMPVPFYGVVHGASVGPHAIGPCGMVAFNGEPVFISDIAREERWPAFRELALANGLRACWSLPLRDTGGKVIATWANYFLEPRAPAEAEVEAAMITGHLVAMAIERYQSGLAMREKEARHRQILNSATDYAIISTDLQGRVTSWNAGATQLLGWSEQEMLGKDAWCSFTQEDKAAGWPEEAVRKTLRQGRMLDERWHVRKDGERFWGVDELSLLKSDAGEVVGFVRILRDRTDKQRSEAKLRDLNETLERQVEQRSRELDRIWRNSVDLLLVIGNDGLLQAVNPACIAMLGYQPSAITGQHLANFVHPEDLGRIYEAIPQKTADTLENFEVRVRHCNGSFRWFAWRAVPEDGVFYAIGRDVTNEKLQSEQWERAHEARLQLALESGGMGVWEWDLQARTAYWLRGIAELHGLSPGSGPRVTTLDEYLRYVHPEDHEKLRKQVQGAFREGGDYQAEYRVVWPDGSVHWIEGRGKAFRENGEQPRKMIGVAIEVTERKRTELNLKFLAQASAELAGLVDKRKTLERLARFAVPAFADWCVVDLLDENDVLVRVAAAHAEPAKESLLEDMRRRFPPHPVTPRGSWHVVRTGEAVLIDHYDAQVMARSFPDPEYRAALQQIGIRCHIGVPISAHGRILGVLTFVAANAGRNYTEADLALATDLGRRAGVALENLGLYQSLQQSDHAKDVFLATLAHELRNPLAAIINGLSVMRLAADDERRITQCTGIIERQTNHLVRLVDDLMEVSRISTGKIELRREIANLGDILRNAIETNRPYIEAANHQLEVHLPEYPLPLLADVVRLGQAFSNLINNAAKYTQAGGRIEISLQATPYQYEVRIRDTGIGIPSDMLTKIFTMFTQVRHPIERGQGGLGIGLCLVKGLVELHGGSVEAISGGQGQGSEFVVRLPCSLQFDEPAPAGSPVDANGMARLSTRRVLVVDDNIDAANTVADILRLLGNEVAAAHDGTMAVSIALEQRPDIILLDIGLPGIDGYEVARRLRAHEATRNAELIALTGWGQEKDRRLAWDAGFDQHWVKPVSLEQLMTIMEKGRTDTASSFAVSR